MRHKTSANNSSSSSTVSEQVSSKESAANTGTGELGEYSRGSEAAAWKAAEAVRSATKCSGAIESANKQEQYYDTVKESSGAIESANKQEQYYGHSEGELGEYLIVSVYFGVMSVPPFLM